jgi:hypothetical protein
VYDGGNDAGEFQMKCVIYDFETLSLDVDNGVAVSLAMLNFDTSRFVDQPYEYEELLDYCDTIKYDVEDQVKVHKRVMDPGTLKWWGEQSKEAQALLKPSSEDVSITKTFEFFTTNAADGVDWFLTRRATLDQPLLKSLCESSGNTMPYSYWKFREVVSLINGLTFGHNIPDNFIPEGLKDKFVAHDPPADISMDVMRLQTIVQEIQ